MFVQTVGGGGYPILETVKLFLFNSVVIFEAKESCFSSTVTKQSVIFLAQPSHTNHCLQ